MIENKINNIKSENEPTDLILNNPKSFEDDPDFDYLKWLETQE